MTFENIKLPRFEDNWYDTVESIKDLDGEALEKMKVPMRVIELIQKKLGGSQEKVTVKTKPQEERMIYTVLILKLCRKIKCNGCRGTSFFHKPA